MSRVINGGRNVRPAVLDAVNAAIDALGYSVNQAARNLARGRTGSIAFVISDREERLFEDPNFGLFARVFSRQLRKTGRHLLITTAQDEQEENFLGDYLTLGHVDGALLALTHEEEPLLGRLLSHRLPLVVLGKPLGFEDAFSWVAIDDEKAAFTVVSYLAARVDGADRDRDRAAAHQQRPRAPDGYRRALGNQFRPGSGRYRRLVAAAAAIMALSNCSLANPGLRGLFVASDLMAVGAMGALREAGRRVPERRGRGRVRQLRGGHHGRARPDHHAQPDRADRPGGTADPGRPDRRAGTAAGPHAAEQRTGRARLR